MSALASIAITTPGLAVANSMAAVEAGVWQVQGCVNGYGERCGNADILTILANLKLKMGLDVVDDEQLARLTEVSHYLDELCNVTPDADAPYVGRNAFAHKAGMHAAGVAADARTFEHLEPAAVGNARDILPRSSPGKATIRTQAERAGLEIDEEAAGARRRPPSRSASTAAITTRRRRPPSSCCCVRRRAATNRCSSSRAFGSRPRSAPTARSGPGCDQSQGRRRALSAGRRGQWAGQRPRPGATRRDRRPPPTPRRHRADQLQGPDPRREPRHRRRHPGPARLLRRRAGVGDDRRLGEHHRGLLGGAGRFAGVRVSGMSDEPDNDPIPLARPEIDEREEALVLEVLRSGRLSLGPMVERFESAFAAWLGVEDAVAVSSGTTALHLGVLGAGLGEGDEVLTSPLSFVASAASSTSGCGRSSWTWTPDPEHRPRPHRGRHHPADPRDPAGPRLRAAVRHDADPRDRGAAPASRSSRTPARRSALAPRTACGLVRPRGDLALASTRTSSSPPARAARS